MHLNVFMAHADRVLMAGLAQSTNVIQSLFLTNTASGGTDLVKTPTFYVFKMYVPHHVNGATWAPNTLASESITGNGQTFPVLSVGTTVDAAGGVNISLVNVDLVNSRTIDITLDSDWAAYGVSSAQIITGAQKDTYNDFGQPEAVNIQTPGCSELPGVWKIAQRHLAREERRHVPVGSTVERARSCARSEK